MLALKTLGAPQRRRLRGRRGQTVTDGDTEPVPTSRATAIRAAPFHDETAAAAWLDAVRSSETGPDEELADALKTVNRALAAHRAARATPYARDVSAEGALVIRVGYGSGEAVAEGQFAQAWELPRGGAKVKRSMEAPDERFAALLGGRETALASEELVLRARSDLEAARGREAALQTRIALETVLAELTEGLTPERRSALDADRSAIGDAANAALRGDLDESALDAVAETVERLEGALRAHRLVSPR